MLNLSRRTAWLFVFLLFVALLAPIGFYGYHFGVGMWDKHSDWALMGTALSGIYTPILTLLTLLVITIQLVVTHKSINHSNNMEYINDGKSEYKESLDRLMYWLNPEKSAALDELLLILNETPEQDLKDKLYSFAEKYPIIHLWRMNSYILTDFGTRTDKGFKLAYLKLRGQTETLLGISRCKVLDKATSSIFTIRRNFELNLT